MSLMQGIKLYPKAIGWAAVISTCCILEGFSIALIGNFYAFAPFNRKYGELQDDGTYQVSASWQAAISNGAQCGQILGLLRKFSSPAFPICYIRQQITNNVVTGVFVERIGYRLFLLASIAYQGAMVTIFFLASSIKILMVAYCFTGISFGVFMSIAISYAAEICPVALRGYLTTWGNSCWGIGQLLAIAVIRSMFTRSDEWAYRIPYGLQVCSPFSTVIYLHNLIQKSGCGFLLCWSVSTLLRSHPGGSSVRAATRRPRSSSFVWPRPTRMLLSTPRRLLI